MLARTLTFAVGLSAIACLAADDCTSWTDPANRYSVCLPNSWYHRTMPSGALFLCDVLQGKCTVPVGGGPLLGHAILSILPAQIALAKAPATLEEFAHQVADKDPSSKFSKAVSEAGRSGSLSYIVVSQTYTTGAHNELPQNIYLYFVQASGQMIELILAYNSGDERSQMYRDTALKIITSIGPE